MSEMVLAIIEVSQKQAYIFSSNKLKDNIRNSENIVTVTSPDYFKKKYDEFEEDSIVYSGGGHTVLCFDSEEKAKRFSRAVSMAVAKEYPDMELFICVKKYDDEISPGNNLRELTKALERKKSIRRSSFMQGTFGIEKIDSVSLKPVLAEKGIVGRETDTGDSFVPEGYEAVSKFENLGGSKNDSNFIAIVHIDGNCMGRRVSELYEKLDSEGLSWDEYRVKLKDFSDGIDKDFKDAFYCMNEYVKAAIEKGELGELSLKHNNFPVRKIIISGDDVCFVTEGRIGVECARIFLEKLCNENRKNSIDGRGYMACAGVAIVHQKYPFFRAYDLAENLCSNAKRYCAGLDTEGNGASLAAIDWHISFGELGENIDEIREDYITQDKNHLELRPYIICGKKEFLDKEPNRMYSSFREVMKLFSKKSDKDSDEYYASNKIKMFRTALKQGKTGAKKYIVSNKIQGFVNNKILKPFNAGEGNVFVETHDGSCRSLIYDAIELMDTFIVIGDE